MPKQLELPFPNRLGEALEDVLLLLNTLRGSMAFCDYRDISVSNALDNLKAALGLPDDALISTMVKALNKVELPLVATSSVSEV